MGGTASSTSHTLSGIRGAGGKTLAQVQMQMSDQPVPPHKFPLRVIGHAWPEQFRPTRDFQELEDQYHGHQKPLELVTGGHLTRSLDALIKSRS